MSNFHVVEEYTKQLNEQQHKPFVANIFPKIVHTDLIGRWDQMAKANAVGVTGVSRIPRNHSLLRYYWAIH